MIETTLDAFEKASFLASQIHKPGNESADSLPQGAVPTLNVASLNGLLSNGLMLAPILGADRKGFPKITEGSTPAIFWGSIPGIFGRFSQK